MGNAGQVLVIYALALPVALGFCALVIDLGASYVEKRSLQQAADAAALAAAQELKPALGSCDVLCMQQVNAAVALRVGQYSADNGGPSTVQQCASPSDPNPCYTWPYNGSNGLVQVRLNKTSNTYFAGILGAPPGFLKPAVKAVAKASAITETHCSFPPGTQYPAGDERRRLPQHHSTVHDPRNLARRVARTRRPGHRAAPPPWHGLPPWDDCCGLRQHHSSVHDSRESRRDRYRALHVQPSDSRESRFVLPVVQQPVRRWRRRRDRADHEPRL